MLRIVVDTSVVVAGLRSRRGASHVILTAIAGRRLRPLVSVALFLEYEQVLTRPTNLVAHGLGMDGIETFLRAFAAAAEHVDIRYRWRPQLPDPDDELVLETAVNGNADALVTHNVRDFAVAGPRLGVKVLAPGDFVAEIPT